MSQAMNQKPVSKKKKLAAKLEEVEVPEELTGIEKLFESIKPLLTTIGLVIVAGLLGFVAIAFLIRSRFDKQAIQWREFTTSSAIALRTGDINGLKDVATTYPDTKAGLWSLQMAGDQQLRMGLDQLTVDREAGNQMIEKAAENFASVVNAPQTAKTTMLDRRSHFSLAYAYESLGKFDEAKKIYDELIEAAPDSAFADPARRGSARSGNDQYASLYNKFANFEEEVIGEAPSAPVPEGRPNIDFGTDTDLEPGQKPPMTSPLESNNSQDNDFDTTGGDTSAATESETEKPADTEKESEAASEKVETESDSPPKPEKEDN